MPEQSRNIDAAQRRSVNAVHHVFGASTTQARLLPKHFLIFAFIGTALGSGLHDRNHAPIQLADEGFDRRAGRRMFYGSDGFGVGQRMLAHRAGSKLDSIMLAQFLSRAHKGFFGAKIRQGSLQRQGVSPVSYLGLLAKRSHLNATASLAQTLLLNANIPVSRMPAQEFFFL